MNGRRRPDPGQAREIDKERHTAKRHSGRQQGRRKRVGGRGVSGRNLGNRRSQTGEIDSESSRSDGSDSTPSPGHIRGPEDRRNGCVGPGCTGWNIAGATDEMVTRSASLMPPGVRSTTSARPSIWAAGRALICVDETKRHRRDGAVYGEAGIGQTVGRGTSVLESVIGLNWLPKIVTRPPGATGLVKSAELTTRSITGGAVKAS